MHYTMRRAAQHQSRKVLLGANARIAFGPTRSRIEEATTTLGIRLRSLLPAFLLLLSLGAAHTQDLVSTPRDDPATIFLTPPRVKRLVAVRTGSQGETTFYLLRCDGTNFYAKSADTRKHLDDPRRIGNSRVGGRWENQIWECWEDGYLRATDLRAQPASDTNVNNHQYLSLSEVDGASRIPRAILSLGIESSFWSTNFAHGNQFSLSSINGQKIGTVHFGSAAGASVPYDLIYTNHPYKSDLHADAYVVHGSLPATNCLPQWYEVYRTTGGGPPVEVMRMDVLEVELSGQPLPKEMFLPEQNVTGGFLVALTRTNDQLIVSHLQGSGWNAVSLFGLQVTPVALRVIIAFLLIGSTMLFLVAIRKKTKTETIEMKEI